MSRMMHDFPELVSDTLEDQLINKQRLSAAIKIMQVYRMWRVQVISVDHIDQQTAIKRAHRELDRSREPLRNGHGGLQGENKESLN